MNHKNYYNVDYFHIPEIDKSDLIPGTILVGTRETFGVRCFPWRAFNNAVRLFNSNIDTATIISVRTKENDSWGSAYYSDDNLILLNNTQKTLFVVSACSKLFVKLGSR